jgi:2-polyprenyl-3-methyl-5-hydroxy-6-metoxy-1,4-benzoquinol methylase
MNITPFYNYCKSGFEFLLHYFSFDNHRTETENMYDRMAPIWSSVVNRLGFYSAYHALVHDAFDRSHIDERQPEFRVLDVGTGGGTFALAFLDNLIGDLEIDLLDNSSQMLAAAQKTLQVAGHRCKTIYAGLGQSERNIGVYDVVLAAHVIEHLTDHQAAIKSLFDLLKPGGTLFLVVSKPHWCSKLVWLNMRHRVYTAPEVMDALNRSGFQLCRPYYFPKGPPSRLSIGYFATR